MVGPRPENIPHDPAPVPPQRGEHSVAEMQPHRLLEHGIPRQKMESREFRGAKRQPQAVHRLSSPPLDGDVPAGLACAEEGLEPAFRLRRRVRKIRQRDARRVVLENQLRRLDRQALGDEAEPEIRAQAEQALLFEVEPLEAAHLLACHPEHVEAHVLDPETSQQLDRRLVVRTVENGAVQVVAVVEPHESALLAVSQKAIRGAGAQIGERDRRGGFVQFALPDLEARAVRLSDLDLAREHVAEEHGEVLRAAGELPRLQERVEVSVGRPQVDVESFSCDALDPSAGEHQDEAHRAQDQERPPQDLHQRVGCTLEKAHSVE
jgi:hypothetical protein